VSRRGLACILFLGWSLTNFSRAGLTLVIFLPPKLLGLQACTTTSSLALLLD
jgi:hypothetical protein